MRYKESTDKRRFSKLSFKEYIKENDNIRVILSFLIPIMAVIIITAIFAVPKIIEAVNPKEKAKDFTTTYNPEIMAFSNAQDIDYSEYPQSLIELLYRNRETRDFVLNYPLLKDKKVKVDLSDYKNLEAVPLFMQWDKRWGYINYGNDVAGITGCGPVCLSMCAYYLTGDESYSPDKMIKFAIDEGYCVYGNGTSWELFSKGAVDLGFDVTEIGLDKDRVINNLEVGNPIVAIMGEGDFTTSGHFIVFSGTENGLIKVNDPNSYQRSELLWEFDDIKDQIRNMWVIRNKPEE
ncbi:MAG: C39 family peptidase [Clostridia bacterium]|nr:C39 family peptidase [Clostridia bacterium]